MITTIFIDVDNTLLDFGKCADDTIQKGFAEWNLPYNKHVTDIFRAINRQLWSEIQQGTLSREKFLKIRWQMVFDALHIDRCGAEFENVFIKNLMTSHIAVDGALDMLQYLAKKYTLCIASNAPHEQQVSRLKKAGMMPYLSHIFTSGLFGYSKPQKEFFDGCFSLLPNTKKSEVLMLGDSISADIEGAKAYGLQTCWFNYDKEECTAVNCADYIINNFSEIRNIL